jgi:endonuclease G
MLRKFFKACFIACLLVLTAGVAVLAIYALSGKSQRAAIENVMLDGVDLVRESPTTPASVVGTLDKVADTFPVVVGDVIAGPPPDPADASPYGDPVGPWLHLVNPGYEVGYDEVEHVPRWVAYKVMPNKGVHAARPSGFRSDTRTYSKVRSEVYTHSGYDRGHMAPNYAMAVCHGEAAQYASFLMTNITPQLHGLNAGLWKDIELRITQRYTERYGEVWVVNGPIFSSTMNARYIGPSDTRVRVPDAFWMVLMTRTPDGRIRTETFLIPHREIWRDLDLSRYLVSIDEIERLSGLDLFPLLSKEIQGALEASPAPRAW